MTLTNNPLIECNSIQKLWDIVNNSRVAEWNNPRCVTYSTDPFSQNQTTLKINDIIKKLNELTQNIDSSQAETALQTKNKIVVLLSQSKQNSDTKIQGYIFIKRMFLKVKMAFLDCARLSGGFGFGIFQSREKKLEQIQTRIEEAQKNPSTVPQQLASVRAENSKHPPELPEEDIASAGNQEHPPELPEEDDDEDTEYLDAQNFEEIEELYLEECSVAHREIIAELAAIPEKIESTDLNDLSAWFPAEDKVLSEFITNFLTPCACASNIAKITKDGDRFAVTFKDAFAVKRHIPIENVDYLYQGGQAVNFTYLPSEHKIAFTSDIAVDILSITNFRGFFLKSVQKSEDDKLKFRSKLAFQCNNWLSNVVVEGKFKSILAEKLEKGILEKEGEDIYISKAMLADFQQMKLA